MTATRAATIAGVPVLLAAPDASPVGARLPTVLWFHGFRADAVAHAAELERSAALGFLAVGVDAVGHGSRPDPTIASRITAARGGALEVMLAQVDDSVRELPALLHALTEHHDADATRVSLVGISMGAFLVYQAIADGLPVRAAVALLGAPEREGLRSPHRALDRFRHVALLSVTAEHDASVPPAPVQRLHAALASTPDRRAPQRHHVLRGSGHLTTAAAWLEALQETMAWLEQHA